MKKSLYATTALVAVGMTAGGVGSAAAAEKIKLGISGYLSSFLGYTDQAGGASGYPMVGEEKARSGPASRNMPFLVHTNSEIHFTGSTKLDNGISVGVAFELEGGNSGDQIDETYMTVSSPTLGRLILGDENGASYLMHIWAPQTAGLHLDTGTIASLGVYQNTVGGTFFQSPLGTTVQNLGDDDSAKITYISPRVVGFQIGISYVPTYGQNAAAGPPTRTGVYHDGWDVALQYKTEVGGVGIGAMIGGKWADPSDARETSPEAREKMWKAAGSLSYQGFSLGGGWSKVYGGLQGAGLTRKGTSWIIGTTYSTGPYSVGVGYFDGNAEHRVVTPGKDEHKKYILSGAYALGPGVNFVAGVFGFDLEAEGTNVQQGATGEADNSGWGILTGLALSF